MDCAYLELYITIRDVMPRFGFRRPCRFITDVEIWIARRDPYEHRLVLRLNSGGFEEGIDASPIADGWALWAGVPGRRKLHHIKGLANWENNVPDRTRTLVTAHECIRLLDLLKAEQWQATGPYVLAVTWCQRLVTKQDIATLAKKLYGHTARL